MNTLCVSSSIASALGEPVFGISSSRSRVYGLLSRSSCLCVFRRSAQSCSGPRSRVCLSLGSKLSYCCCCFAAVAAFFSAGLLVSAFCAGLLSLTAAQSPGSAFVWALSRLIAAVVLLLLQLSSQQVFLSLRFAQVCSVLQRPEVPGRPFSGLWPSYCCCCFSVVTAVFSTGPF